LSRDVPNIAHFRDTDNILEHLNLLAVAAQPLISACQHGLTAVIKWIKVCNKASAEHDHRAQEMTGQLQNALNDFRVARLAAVRPYRHVFDPAHPASEEVDYRKVWAIMETKC